MTRVIPLAALGAALIALGSGCGHSAGPRAAKVGRHFQTPPQRPAQARSAIAGLRREWFREITSRGRRAKQHRPPLRFLSPGRQIFLAQLRRASARYHFAVDEVRFYRPFQFAPFVVVHSGHPKRFSADTPPIVDLLDVADKRGHSRERYWQYEGFYLEARDGDGVPFLAVSNFIRGKGWGGGQWARTEELYPFAHG